MLIKFMIMNTFNVRRFIVRSDQGSCLCVTVFDHAWRKLAIKARLYHPMVLAVKVWALAHLLANGGLADVLLFGAFLLWAALSFRAARARDRLAHTVYPPGTAAGTVTAIVVGVAAWAGFAFWAHELLIGVRPLG